MASIAAGLRPTASPNTTSASNEPTLVAVKTFCTSLPVRSPLQFAAVSKTTIAMARPCCAETENGPTRIAVSNTGTSVAVNFPNATATAAMVPV